MAESHVVSGLVAKRGKLAGEVEQHRRELQRLAQALGHVEATIRLFDPGYELGAVPARKRGSHSSVPHHLDGLGAPVVFWGLKQANGAGCERRTALRHGLDPDW
jgi:hypothetical protein